MAHKLKIVGEQELVVIVYSARVELDECAEIWRELEAAQEFAPHFDDLRLLAPDADCSDITADAAMFLAQKFVEPFRNRALSRLRRTAFICNDNMHVAMARMFGAFVNCEAVPNVEVADFQSLAVAFDWIEIGRTHRLDRERVKKAVVQMGAGWSLSRTDAA